MSRPSILFPLFAGLETLEGVGPKTAQHFAQMGVEKPRDLVFTLPHSVVDRRKRDSIRDVQAPATVTVEVEVGLHFPAHRKGGPYRVNVQDASTTFQLVFFHAREDWLKKQLPTGQRRLISGRIEIFDGVAQMVHPDHILPVDEADEIPEHEPVYPLTAGITQKQMFKATQAALTRVPEMAEWIDPVLKTREGWPDFGAAVQLGHSPEGAADLAATSLPRVRLAYDELFAHQLTLALARSVVQRGKGRESHATGQLQRKVLAALPYRPTGAQDRAIREISADMALPIAYEPAVAGRCRVRQDAGGVHGVAGGGRGRRAGRHDGPDRDPCASASGRPATFGRRGRRRAGTVDRPR